MMNVNDRTAKSVVTRKDCNTCFWENVNMACTHEKRDQKQFEKMYEHRECWLKWGKKGKTTKQIRQKESVK